MSTARGTPLSDRLARVAFLADACDLLDGDLLEAVVRHRDEAAFETIVRRHGPMVYSVCQRVLQNHHDAEDAFQATFIVLARKAASVKPRHMVGNWLYGVAYRTALEARTVRRKRLSRQGSLNTVPEPAAPAPEERSELHRALDEELSRLPDRYRLAIVLCDLEGRTQEQAARQLACPPGTVACRLVRGRALLAKKLALSVSGASLATALSARGVSAGVSGPLVAATVKVATSIASGGAAASVVSAPVVALTERVMKNMLLSKLKTGTETCLLVCGVTLGLFQVSGNSAQQAPGRDGLENAANKALAPELPVGTWTLEFANGVIELCEVKKDGTTSVVEPLRTSTGKTNFKGSSFRLVFEDNRVEHWTPVGKRFVVEHFFPGDQVPPATPVLGIAVRIGEPDNGLTADEKSRLEESWPVMSKGEIGSGLTDEKARKLIDPRYVEEHKLTEGPFPMARFTRGNLYANQLCADHQTGIMIADTNEAGRPRELFVFRLTVYKGRVYIVPPSPPDPTTKAFKPWIFRAKL